MKLVSVLSCGFCLGSAEPMSVAASPFASQAMGNMPELPSTSRAAAASSTALPKGYSNSDLGPDINLWYQPSSDAVTRAGDVLGMPHLDGYTAKVRHCPVFTARIGLRWIDGLRVLLS